MDIDNQDACILNGGLSLVYKGGSNKALRP